MFYQNLIRWKGTRPVNRAKGTTATKRPASATDVRRDPGRGQDGDGGDPSGVRHTGLSAQSDVMSDPDPTAGWQAVQCE